VSRAAEGLLAEVREDVRRDIESWRGEHPLSALRAGLLSQPTHRAFRDLLAEAVIARLLLKKGCTLAWEAPTPGGRACDFRVERSSQVFFLHVKRLATSRADLRLTISSRLRALERIDRPYVVSVRWREGIDDHQMQQLVVAASEFIRSARVGDELVVRDRTDHRELGGVLIVAPREGTHVAVVIGLPDGFVDETERLRKLLRRAYEQFMPKARNVIIVATSSDRDREDLDAALLGSHEERWDAFPPRGSRIAHGRADDGFWGGSRCDASRCAGWFRFLHSGDPPHVHLWFREHPPEHPAFAALLRDTFGVSGSA